uniref:CD302 molecule n=1 Tax=Podarcis muralis TaxID=64176 RepID=A0A670INQ3_PODMU
MLLYVAADTLAYLGTQTQLTRVVGLGGWACLSFMNWGGERDTQNLIVLEHKKRSHMSTISVQSILDEDLTKPSGADIISINTKEENSFIRSTFCTHWHGPEYISLGMFFDTDENVFKWYDQSKVNFTNWIEEESNEELINTCAVMQTSSGQWKKAACEHLPLTEVLCETSIPYEKKYLPDETAWTTTLVITSTVIVAVSAAFLWYLYQRRVSSGTGCTAYSSTTQVPSSDEVVLVEEENEYTA